MAEAVNHPSHYGGDTVHEHIKVMESWLTPEQFIGYCRGCATKYLCRAEKKGSVQDNLAKAVFFINYELGFRRRMERNDEDEDPLLGHPSYEKCADCGVVFSTVGIGRGCVYDRLPYCGSCYVKVTSDWGDLPAGADAHQP